MKTRVLDTGTELESVTTCLKPNMSPAVHKSSGQEMHGTSTAGTCSHSYRTLTVSSSPLPPRPLSQREGVRVPASNIKLRPFSRSPFIAKVPERQCHWRLVAVSGNVVFAHYEPPTITFIRLSCRYQGRTASAAVDNKRSNFSTLSKPTQWSLLWWAWNMERTARAGKEDLYRLKIALGNYCLFNWTLIQHEIMLLRPRCI